MTVLAAMVAWAAPALATSGNGQTGSPFGPEIAHALSNPPFDPLGTTARVVGMAQMAINAEVQLATSDLAAALRQPHPGQPEALTHPAADTAHAGGAAVVAAAAAPATSLPGLDVASYQGNVNWGLVSAQGAKFAYAKATEGTYYTNPYFASQYEGSYYQGLVRGAYQFAIPNNSSGAAQADFFVAHGGAWAPDNQTLPGMVDLEYNPYGSVCYGLSPAQMVGWIADFVDQYHADTTRWPVIYTTAGWWSACTANTGAFAGNDPLFIANYNGTPFPLAGGWAFYTFWQYSDQGTFPGDQDVFNGAQTRLVALANAGQGPPRIAQPLPPPPPPPNPLSQLIAALLKALKLHPGS
ncbi:MAG: lysozyme [Acidimicrobiales bacterium]